MVGSSGRDYRVVRHWRRRRRDWTSSRVVGTGKDGSEPGADDVQLPTEEEGGPNGGASTPLSVSISTPVRAPSVSLGQRLWFPGTQGSTSSTMLPLSLSCLSFVRRLRLIYSSFPLFFRGVWLWFFGET